VPPHRDPPYLKPITTVTVSTLTVGVI
ncbi:hypothetical protein A2U01_0104784, partial [Trifolium medium]|nr:hypothetical protein [Trifolium medium]